MARINIIVSEKESLDVSINGMKQTTIKFGDDLEIFIESKLQVEELLEELERILLPEDQHRSYLQNEIEDLREEIDNLEEVIKNMEE